jgi:hypothetical protein
MAPSLGAVDYADRHRFFEQMQYRRKLGGIYNDRLEAGEIE